MGQTDRRWRARPLKEGLTLLSLDSQLLAQDRALEKGAQVKHSSDRAGKHVQPQHSIVPPRVQDPGTQRTTESCQGRGHLKKESHRARHSASCDKPQWTRARKRTYVCSWVTVLHRRNEHNAVNQLYFNEMKKQELHILGLLDI